MNRRSFIAAALSTAASSALLVAAKSTRPPNFIVILCDDLGYGDVGAMGGKSIPTPAMDKMAAEGMVLTDYYAPANLCTPSRAGLLTGRYPIRSGMGRVIGPKDKIGLPLSEPTIAKALRPAYATALIGKWHLGSRAPSWPPTKHGFDLFYGIPYSHDMSPLKLFESAGPNLTEQPVDYLNLQQQFYARADRFIEDNRARPFFLELALSSPHLPSYPSKAFDGKSDAGAYGDTVLEIDDIVGRLLAKLKALDIDRDTLVILTSDNGPWFEGSTGGMRGRKASGADDGGYRVPLIARWPGTIPRGKRSDAIAMGIDLLPTFCALAEVPVPKGVEFDGKDIAPVLLDGAPSPHDALLLFDGDDVIGIRTQRWKYVADAWFEGHLTNVEGRGYPQLYDMTRPEPEQYSVASLHPDVVAQLHAQLQREIARFAPLRTVRSGVTAEKMRNAGPRHVPERWQGFPAGD